MPSRRDQARHRAAACEMAVAECGIRENLAKYYDQKSAPRPTLRSGKGGRTNSNTSHQIPARVIEADSARAVWVLDQVDEWLAGGSDNEAFVNAAGRAPKHTAHP